MNIELRGVFAAIAENGFEKNGETIEYNTVYFQYQEEDGTWQVATCTTKKEVRQYLGAQGVIKIKIQEDGRKNMVSFTQSRGKGSQEDND